MTIYQRIASAGALLMTDHYTEGEAPRRTCVVRFHYASGLVVAYDGVRWEVQQKEYEHA